MAGKSKKIFLSVTVLLLMMGAGCTTDKETGTESEEDPCRVDPGMYDEGVEISFDPMDVVESRALFPMPVQAGAMTSGSVILTAFTVSQGNTTLWIWRVVDQNGNIVLVHEEVLIPKDGYVKVDVAGLAPRTTYQYAFFLSGGKSFSSRSVVGMFRTALPDECAEPVTISGTHGTNTKQKPFDALELTSRYELDAFMQLGDYSYNDGARTIGEFRQKWDRTVDDPGYWALLPGVGQYIVWDDHEFRNNDEYYRDMDTQDFIAAKDAFYERNPVPRYSNDSYWNSYRWGKTVEFFVLDSRAERVYFIPEIQLGGILYLSIEQMEWLKQGLLASPCHFKVLLNSVPITNWPGFWRFASYDHWKGFPDQHAELLDFIVEKGIDNVWSVSGDFHVGSVGKVEPEPPWDVVREVLMGPGGNSNGFMWFLYEGLGLEEQVAPPDQFDFFYAFPTATLMTFDPGDDSVEIVFIDAESEEVLFEEKFY